MSANNYVQDRMVKLRDLSFDEVKDLPAYSDEQIGPKGVEGTLATWVDKVDESKYQVVVQHYQHYGFGIGSMSAAGFLIDSNERRRELVQEELYDFI